MSAFLLLGVSLLLGLVMPRLVALPSNMAASLNAWILNIALPALVLVQIPHLHLQPSLLFAAASPWIVFIGSALLFAWIGKRRGWSRGTIGAVTLTCGLGNTAYIGIPLIEALRGHDALGTAVVADQLGSFLALSSVGLAAAAYYAGQRVTARQMALKVLFFPSFMALVVGAVVGMLGGWPLILESLLKNLAQTLTPLALFSVGLQFKAADLRQDMDALVAGLLWKLLLAPVIVALLGWGLGVSVMSWTIGILQAAMAPMITAGILASSNGLNPPLANRIVSIGILLSFLTVPIWSLTLP